MISDHQPTITIFKNLQPIKRCYTIKRISWEMFREDICKRQPAHYLENIDDIEKEASNLTNDLISSLEYATKSKSFTTKAPKPTEIPKILLDLIKLKRKLKRSLNNNYTEYRKKLYNLICRQVKNRIKLFRENKFNLEFQELQNFNQSESKHWKLINRLDESNDEQTNKEDIKLKNNQNIITNDEEEIVEIFGNHLRKIFTPDYGLTQLNSINLDQIN
ncbi:hypothetical protein BpHYR1_050138, partial [Brachionus plicatilis]